MSCKRCGQCCGHMILSFNIDDEWWDEKAWLLAHLGVSLESEEEGEAMVRFDLPCRHLVPAETGKPAACRLQEKKPQVCREYPDEEALDYLRKHPEATPGCGFL